LLAGIHEDYFLMGPPRPFSNHLVSSRAGIIRRAAPKTVDRATYDATITSLERAISDSKAGLTDKKQALKRLARLWAGP
jgi:hypothetical protein